MLKGVKYFMQKGMNYFMLKGISNFILKRISCFMLKGISYFILKGFCYSVQGISYFMPKEVSHFKQGILTQFLAEKTQLRKLKDLTPSLMDKSSFFVTPQNSFKIFFSNMQITNLFLAYDIHNVGKI